MSNKLTNSHYLKNLQKMNKFMSTNEPKLTTFFTISNSHKDFDPKFLIFNWRIRIQNHSFWIRNTGALVLVKVRYGTIVKFRTWYRLHKCTVQQFPVYGVKTFQLPPPSYLVGGVTGRSVKMCPRTKVLGSLVP